MGRTLAVILIWTGVLSSGAAWSEERSLASIMQELGDQTAGLTRALMAEDWPAAAETATAISDHPRPGASERARVMGVLGADAPQFQAADHAVHETAAELAKAARSENREEAFTQYHRLIDACAGCHMQFRDRLRAPADP